MIYNHPNSLAIGHFIIEWEEFRCVLNFKLKHNYLMTNNNWWQCRGHITCLPPAGEGGKWKLMSPRVRGRPETIPIQSNLKHPRGLTLHYAHVIPIILEIMSRIIAKSHRVHNFLYLKAGDRVMILMTVNVQPKIQWQNLICFKKI